MSNRMPPAYGEMRDSGYPAAEIQDDRSDKTPPDFDRDVESNKGEKANLAHTRTETSVQVGHSGEAKYKKLGWIKLTVCLIVEAIALGSLSIPSTFAVLGMVPGVIICVSLGLLSIYSSLVVGQVKLKYPHCSHYAEAVRLIFGRIGFEVTSVMFVLVLILILGGHTLTGTIAWVSIINDPSICAIVFSIISAVLIFLIALPPSFAEFAWFGYVDFVSIIAAILITMVATGVQASNQVGGLSAVDWSVWPQEGTTFVKAFLATTNIVFAYSFAVCQFSFMDEMAKPEDYVKSIWALGIIEIIIYTTTGGVIYAFVGNTVSSPALLSAGSTVARVAFGVALPVIFISGSINGIASARYIMGRAFPNSTIKYVNTARGWVVWIALAAVQTIISWIIAQAVPFFNALLGLISALFISGFTFYFPALFWFLLIKEGTWHSSWRNISLTMLNGLILAIGLAVLGCGTYVSVQDIIDQYASGTVGSSFSCNQAQYT